MEKQTDSDRLGSGRTIEFKMKEFKGQPRVALVQIVPDGTDEDFNPLTIEVTAGGLKIHGTLFGMIETRENLTEFATAISSAFMQSSKMREDVRKKLMGLKV